MSRIKDTWKKVLRDLFIERFSYILTEDEIVNRIKYVLDNFSKFTAEQLYRNCVFCSKRTPISEMALDYSVRFITNFEETFNNPTTCEIDNNPYLSTENKTLLLNRITDQMFIYNAYIDKLINCDNSKVGYEKCKEMISEKFTFPKLYDHPRIWISDPCGDSECIIEKRYYLTIPQIIYAATFNINPTNGQPVSKCFANYVNEHYPEKMILMKAFKDVYPIGTKYLLLL